jgi:hypothetical protein
MLLTLRTHKSTCAVAAVTVVMVYNVNKASKEKFMQHASRSRRNMQLSTQQSVIHYSNILFYIEVIAVVIIKPIMSGTSSAHFQTTITHDPLIFPYWINVNRTSFSQNHFINAPTKFGKLLIITLYCTMVKESLTKKILIFKIPTINTLLTKTTF